MKFSRFVAASSVAVGALATIEFVWAPYSRSLWGDVRVDPANSGDEPEPRLFDIFS